MDEKLLRDMQPFWNSWYIDGVIGEGSYGSVYRVVREEFGQKYYSALKIISTPKNKSELKQALMEGMSEKDAQEYFKSKAEEIYKEIIMMAKLKGKSSIVSYEDHQVVERKDGQIGYDILIRMELLKGLNDYVMGKSLEIPEIVRMGKEVCQGLVLCQNNGIMHRDIKPDNIFITQDGEFKLGDFGIAKKMESLEHGFTIRGTYEYMAPEVYHGEEYDQRVDIYSLGIVLYMFLNKKKTPFLPTDTTKINHGMRQEALKQRFSGQQMEAPLLAGEELGYVIMKAIAYEPKDRYQNAREFLAALESITEKEMEVFEGDQKAKNENIIKRLNGGVIPDNKKDEKDSIPLSGKDFERTVSLEARKEFEEGTVSQEKDSKPGNDDKKDGKKPLEDKKPEDKKDGKKPSEDKKPENKKDGKKPPENKKPEAKKDDKKPLESKKPEDKKDGKKPLEDKKQEGKKDGKKPLEDKKQEGKKDGKKEEGKPSDNRKKDEKENVKTDVKNDDLYLEPILLGGKKPEEARDILKDAGIYQDSKKKSSPLVITLISLVVVVAVIALVLMQNGQNTEPDEDNTGGEVVATVSSPEPDEPEESPSVEPEESPTVEPEESPSAEPDESPVPEPIKDFPDANSSGLKDITKLENYQYAENLNLINNKIKDITPLKECIYLKKLNASYNRISDISALGELTSLEELDLIHNAISDISPLGSLTELKSLKLADNNISDLEALSALENLEELDLSNNPDIKDLTPILNLKKLKNVYILELDGVNKKQVKELTKLVEDNGGMLFE